jgi:hypothetical protein
LDQEKGVTFEYDLNADDLIHGTLTQMRFLRRWMIGFAIFLVANWLLDFAFIAIAHFPPHKAEDLAIQIATTVIGLAVVSLLMWFLLLPWLLRKRVRENPFLFSGIVMKLDDNGISFRNAKTASDWQWSDLVGFRESTHVFLICSSKTFGHIVPKRLLSSADGDALRAAVESKLKRLS